ncbi:MAG: transglycosylase SLT domain-containing protein [Zetaproteobacteria bacterium]|nr:transglycosylase SLT domain-containing protein [Zetaproteobacteria bacterium]
MTNPYSLVFCLLASITLLTGCAISPPKNLNDSCAIFQEKDDWYPASLASYKKWGIPISVQLAIIWQESRFQYDAKAPKDTLFGFIPWGRKSSAYGFGQVKDDTWDWYIDQSGNWGADRDDFTDVVDFIGWYCSYSHRTLGIAKTDTYNLYLAYHEGHAGWKRKTYRTKTWLVQVAKKVQRKADGYAYQLSRCEHQLQQPSGWFW